MNTINYNGSEYEYGVIVGYMKDEIREDMHFEFCESTDQEFFDEYIKRDPEFMDRLSNDLYPIN